MKKKKTSVSVRSIPYKNYLLGQLKYPYEMEAYLVAAIEDKDLAALKLALQHCLEVVEDKLKDGGWG